MDKNSDGKVTVFMVSLIFIVVFSRVQRYDDEARKEVGRSQLSSLFIFPSDVSYTNILFVLYIVLHSSIVITALSRGLLILKLARHLSQAFYAMGICVSNDGLKVTPSAYVDEKSTRAITISNTIRRCEQKNTII